MNSTESLTSLLVASGGDTVKLFDVSKEPQDPCILTYTPSPGFQVNCVKWNHTNWVVASAGDDKKISLWKKNGQTMGTIPVAGTDAGDNIEESISTISFSNKASRYICTGGSSQVVRIWDLQRKRCIKKLKGHTDTITGAMYNCRDEHLASISLNGDLILHNLASGAKAVELKDPNGQVLRVLDYCKISRHSLVTAGDDGSIHYWDTTGRTPKVSWLRQHSAPTSGVGFSPSSDKMIASVGLDKKLYTYDTTSRRPSFCIPYEAPFSSLSFMDDGLTLAAGTSSGRIVFYDIRGKPQPLTVLRAYGNSEAVTSLCWQRSKPVITESNCTDETALLGSALEDSILMPDPLPSVTVSSNPGTTNVSGSRNPSRLSSSVDTSSFSGPTSSTLVSAKSDVTPLRTGVGLTRLHAPRNYKDDMEVFSPIVEVEPITPSLDKLWDKHDGLKNKPSYLFPSRRFSEEMGHDTHPIFDWKTSKSDDVSSSSITPPEDWGADKFPQYMPSRLSTSLSSGSVFSGLMNMKEISNEETSLNSTTTTTSISQGTQAISSQFSRDSLGPSLSIPRSSRYSNYVDRVSATSSIIDVGSPKNKKTGAETKEEILSGLYSSYSRSIVTPTSESMAPALVNGGFEQTQKSPTQSDTQQGSSSFTLQLFQRTLEETLASFQKSIHEDMRNLHIEIIRQFHMQETEMTTAMKEIVENQAELMKEVQSLRKETQQLRKLL